jgi:hypothetical protein
MRVVSLARRRAVALCTALVAVATAVGVGGVVATPSGAATSNTLNVTAGEYVYQLKGAPKPGWVTINFKNAGVEYHMLDIIALKPGVTVAQLKQAVTSTDENAANALIDTSVGQEGNIAGVPALIGPKSATTTATNLPAGHYGMLCFIPAASDGAPHAAHGMIKVIDVKGAKSSAKPPTTQATVTLKDDGIDFPLTNPGRNLSLKITNAGTTPHSFQLVKLEAGKTVADAKAYFDALFNGQAPAGDPPATLIGGLTSIDPGATGYLEQTLAAGHYAYVSTEGDDPANDDSTRGLLGEFDVK